MSAPAIPGCPCEGAQMARFGMKNRRFIASDETGLSNRRVSGGCADHLWKIIQNCNCTDYQIYRD